jgi:hypothetical protein
MPRKLQKNKWLVLPEEKDVQFLIKPFSVLYLKTVPTDENISSELMWDVFRAVVVDWKGLQDENGKDMKCTDENKRKVAEQFNDILSFVFSESMTQDDTGVTKAESKN